MISQHFRGFRHVNLYFQSIATRLCHSSTVGHSTIAMPSDTLSATAEASALSISSPPGTASTVSTDATSCPVVVVPQQETPPRVIHVLPEPVPYAQLCLRRDDNGDRLCILMVGKNSSPGKKAAAGLHNHQYKPLKIERDEDNDKYGASSPTLGHISSSQSSATNNSSSADVVELEDLGWASNGWPDLRMDSSSVSSTGSRLSGSSSLDKIAEGRLLTKESQEIILQSAHWVGEIQDSYEDEAGLYSDAWRLLGDSSVEDDIENTDLLDASVCGRLIRSWALCRGGVKPYYKALHRHSARPPSTDQPATTASIEYSALP